MSDPLSAPTLEADLRALREARGRSVEALQQETRIPSDVIVRFEEGKLAGDPFYNEVYLRAFLKSYAQALDLPTQDILSAYEADRRGTYQGELRAFLQDVTPDLFSETHGREDAPRHEPLPPQPPAANTSGGRPLAVAALSGQTPPPVPRGPAEGSPAMGRPRRAHTRSGRPLDRAWGGILAATIVALLLIAAVLFFLFRGEHPEPIEERVAAMDTTRQDSARARPQRDTAAVAGPRLPDTLRVTLVAQGGPLQGFRVQVAGDARRPVWLEQGEERVFESLEEVVLWGNERDGNWEVGTNAVVRFAGLAFRPDSSRAFRVNRQNGQAILDSLARRQARPQAQSQAPPQEQAQPPAPPAR